MIHHVFIQPVCPTSCQFTFPESHFSLILATSFLQTSGSRAAAPEEGKDVTNSHSHLPAGPFSQAFPGGEGLGWDVQLSTLALEACPSVPTLREA